MSVHKSRRKESRFEPIVYSNELYSIFQDLLARNLGINDPDKLIRRKFKYGKSVKEDFPFYRNELYQFKDRINKRMLRITDDLRAANSIYVTSMAEYDKRRGYQDDAIIECELILKDLMRFVEVFDVDLNQYQRYVEALEREINLIKRWRQRDNQLKDKL